MNEALRHYLELEARLLEWRAAHSEDSPEEDALLDEMDRAWWALTDSDRKWIDERRTPPR